MPTQGLNSMAVTDYLTLITRRFQEYAVGLSTLRDGRVRCFSIASGYLFRQWSWAAH